MTRPDGSPEGAVSRRVAAAIACSGLMTMIGDAAAAQADETQAAVYGILLDVWSPGWTRSSEAEQVLMSPDGSTLTVPAPVTTEGRTLSGDGWTVTLAQGWVVRPGPRTGDLRVVRQDE